MLFLLWLIQSTSLSGLSTLDRCCLMLFPFKIPVDEVRGGMAFGDAKGWDVDVDGIVVRLPWAGRHVCMSEALLRFTTYSNTRVEKALNRLTCLVCLASARAGAERACDRVVTEPVRVRSAMLRSRY